MIAARFIWARITTKQTRLMVQYLQPIGDQIVMGRRQPRPVPKLLAPKLLRIRERLGVGQAEMARLLADTPIPPDGGSVSRFERGEREPNLFVILEYARLGEINPVLLIEDQYSVKFMDRQIPKDVGKGEGRGRTVKKK